MEIEILEIKNKIRIQRCTYLLQLSLCLRSDMPKNVLEF